MKDVLKETTVKMDGALTRLKNELKTLRTGRANAGILDHVTAEVYGTKMRLSDMATVSVAEARMLIVSPFDATNVHAINKGIIAANLNVQSTVDGKIVRVKIPEMDNSVRQEMVKESKKMGEESKISIRNARREANDFIKAEKSKGNMAEDVMKSLEKKIQELTDKFCKQADELCSAKEKEIVTI